uniref:Uncharacterized protein n=1 Tax=Heterorhabditis bacteriophora TaxID=37862 RepID=A0A1I7W7H3_HETBA
MKIFSRRLHKMIKNWETRKVGTI